jgi:transposase-like protein
MRYSASEKLEIIRTVETSTLPVRRTLAQIGIPKSTFYAWLDRYAAGGLEALQDRKARPERVWNRIPDKVRQKVKPTARRALSKTVPARHACDASPSSRTAVRTLISSTIGEYADQRPMQEAADGQRDMSRLARRHDRWPPSMFADGMFATLCQCSVCETRS